MKTDGWSDYKFETYVNTDGNNSKIMQGRVIIIVHCTPP
jgi:hypothetical protein